MKFLLEENREWRRAAIGKSKGINPGPPLGRSGILSTRRVETTTQVLLSLIVKEPRICAAEILRNNRTNEAFAKAFAEGLPPLPPRPAKETFGRRIQKGNLSIGAAAALRYEKHGADRVREILERDSKETRLPS